MGGTSTLTLSPPIQICFRVVDYLNQTILGSNLVQNGLSADSSKDIRRDIDSIRQEIIQKEENALRRLAESKA